MKGKKKLIIGLLLLFVFTGGGLTVVIADTSISGVLSGWLSNKTEESIQKIDTEIQKEQAKQTEWLKAELQANMNQLEKEMDVFVEMEKQKRLTAIEKYADGLLTEITAGRLDGKTEIEEELDRIYQEAVEEMNAISDNQEWEVSEEQEQ